MYYTIGFSWHPKGKKSDLFSIAPGNWHTGSADIGLLDPGSGLFILAGGDPGRAISSGTDALFAALVGNFYMLNLV